MLRYALFNVTRGKILKTSRTETRTAVAAWLTRSQQELINEM